jgi:EmrB/QacA subfamily drug resistance transporter
MNSFAPAPASEHATSRQWWVLAVVGVAQLLIMVDTTVMNIALPAAQHDLGMSDASRQWTISAYSLAFGALLLLGGRLADRLGRRNTLLAGITGFALASAIGGAASGPGMLIAARATQGLFAALLAPSTMSLLTTTFTEPRARARAFGVFSALMMSGAAVGLLLGGALTQYLTWRWCLYINLPIAAAVGVAGWFMLPDVERHREVRLDWLSSVLSGGGVVALVYGLSEVADHGWTSALVAGLLIGAAVLLTTFVLRQARSKNPLLPLSIITNRGRAAAFLAVSAAPFGMYGMFFFLTYQLQQIMGYGALVAGLAFLPMLAGNVIMSTQVTRRLLPRTGPRLLLTIGLLLIAAGMLGLTQLTPASSFLGLILPAEFVLGIGTGLVMPTVMNTATGGVAPKDSGAASAFVSTVYQLGASIGTATLNTVAAGVTASAVSMSFAAATVRGFAVASWWAVGVLVLGAVAVVVLAPAGSAYRRTEPA